MKIVTDPAQSHELWNNAHTATLEDYGVRESKDAANDPLYHPDATKYFDDWR